VANQWQEGDVTTNGVRLHYYRTGGGKPPIMLSHGITTTGSAGREWRKRWSLTTTSSWWTPAGMGARRNRSLDTPIRTFRLTSRD